MVKLAIIQLYTMVRGGEGCVLDHPLTVLLSKGNTCKNTAIIYSPTVLSSMENNLHTE